MSSIKSFYDVVILGSGHNALVAASYLAGAGQSVLVLEKRSRVGGATSSRKVFKGVDVNLSEYSYLLSLLPEKIIKDLGLKINAKRRFYASYTPFFSDLSKSGLLLSNASEKLNREAFLAFTKDKREYKNYLLINELEKILAQKVWPTLLSPLMTRSEMKSQFKGKKAKMAWDMFIEKPLGIAIEKYLKSDPVRGLIFTDAKIGILTHPNDKSLLQNRTFLYHIIGNGTGEWRVPIGGMGEIARQIEAKARKEGTQIVTDAEVVGIKPDPINPVVKFKKNGKIKLVKAKYVLSGMAPSVLSKFLKTKLNLSKDDSQGTEFKINMVLSRLPKLKDPKYRAKDAFCGTFHINEGYDHMKKSYQNAVRGKFTENPPGEMYCQTLTDSSILSPALKKKGYQTLTLFGLDMPYKMFKRDNEGMKKKVLKKYIEAINEHLQEPIEECVARDVDGKLCIEARSPVDIENELGMTMGNIFHNDPSWPFVEKSSEAGQWGVEIGYPNIFICGSGARRGGCVSGIPGHNAAMKVLSLLKVA